MAGGTSNDDDGLIAGINVTPLVDVTLVLLIIFMVTARIIVSQGMPMDLPKAASGEALQQVFSVELTVDGKTRVDSNDLPNDEAITGLAKAAKAKTPDLRAVIRADRKVEHGRVIHVLDLLKRAGVAKIAFAVSPADAKGSLPVETQPGK
ncbi:MAG TPA: biopolymer transporter ExbD [Polyangiaceae bacterium]|jgi:biopolymer transport protein ExbD|nr:biopolymer transporter ExbD [Polyangiaceae bacterium]